MQVLYQLSYTPLSRIRILQSAVNKCKPSS